MIEVLKQMQKALREYHYYTIDAGLPNQSMLNKGYAAYQAGLKAIAELESQEPVAWRRREVGGGWQYFGWQETGMTYQDIERWNKNGFECEAIFATPPQRTWVGLTDADFREIYETYPIVEEDPWDYERAIEAKLKERNT